MIRRPRDNEAEQCAFLLYQSGPEVFDYLFASPEELVCRYLVMLFPEPDTAFSNKYILVEEQGGEIRGAVAALPGREKHQLEKNIGRYFWELAGLAGVFRSLKMMTRGRLSRYLSVIDEDEYYIQNLAVHAAHRGKRVGPALLAAAADVAADAGYRKLSLLVELNNHHARHVYDSFGFVMEREVVLPKKYAKHSLFGFCKVVKKLQHGPADGFK